MSTIEIQRMANDLLRKHGLTQAGWTFKWDNSKNRGGQCRYSKREIGLSKPIFSQSQNQHGALNVILHEIAHALVGPGHGHDLTWRRQARAIGCTGDRCHDLEVAAHKYLGTCSCGEIHKRHRLPRQWTGGPLANMTCLRCRQIVRWRMRGQR